MNCPICGSSNINRIGLYEYECEDCGDVFDMTEGVGEDDDPIDLEEDESEDMGLIETVSKFFRNIRRG